MICLNVILLPFCKNWRNIINLSNYQPDFTQIILVPPALKKMKEEKMISKLEEKATVGYVSPGNSFKVDIFWEGHKNMAKSPNFIQHS